MNILFGNAGQYGDLIMNTVVARAIKEKFPESTLTMGIGNIYKEIEPLFKNHPIIENTHVWDSYDKWPTQKDIEYFENNKYDIILNAMPQHPQNHLWYKLINHQCEAVTIMNGLTPPKDLSCYLEKYFEVPSCKDYIAISPFTAWNKKNISKEKWQAIINYIVKERGFNVLQLGAPNEYHFKDTFYPNDGMYSWPPWDYFQSVKKMLGCTFIITLDGGLNWVSSAYSNPTLALLGHHYDGLNTSKLYQPINVNGYYLEAPKAEDIPNELIFAKIDEMIDKYY